MEPLVLFIFFIIKHFIFDFYLQGPYMYLNKGKYGHEGGIWHALMNMMGSFLAIITGGVFITFFIGIHLQISFLMVLAILIAEGIIHYHIDWAKINICKSKNWEADNSEQYWWMLGLDQALHYLTYVWMIWMLI